MRDYLSNFILLQIEVKEQCCKCNCEHPIFFLNIPSLKNLLSINYLIFISPNYRILPSIPIGYPLPSFVLFEVRFDQMLSNMLLLFQPLLF